MPLNPPIPDWSGRVVWLVGASSGIGLACAERLAERGARVVVSARRVEALQDFTRRHRDSLALPLDVTEPGVLQGAAETIRARWGRVDLVVYCAGHYRAQYATDYDLAEMLRHQQINWTGALYLLDAVLPLLRAQGSGHLSLVASVAGYRALPRALAYGPTKAALQQLAEALHLELRPLGIGVSVVNPGFVETPLTAQNDFRMPALISPLAAADAMLAGWQRGDYEIHFPKRFTRVLKLLRLLPTALYLPLIRRLTAPAR